MTLLESVHCHGLELWARQAGYAAADSVMAGFDREVFEKYGLLFYDGGFGLGLTQYEQIEDEFKTWYEKNTEPAVSLLTGSFFRIRSADAVLTDAVYATDYRGSVFVDCALDFYKYDKASALLTTIQEQLGVVSQGEKAKEAQNSASEAEKRVKTAFDEASGENDQENAPKPETGSKTDYTSLMGTGLLGKIKELKKKGWLSLAFPKNRTMSAYQIDTKDLPSVTSVDKRKAAGSTYAGDLLKKASFDEYLLDYFSSFLDERERTGLQYELEYIIIGKDKDDENLKKTLNRILLIREGLNLLSIEKSDVMKAEAKALATVMVGWLGIPVVISLTALLIEGAWAYAESIADVRALLTGEKVPILKDASDWRLNLTNAVYFLSGDGAVEKNSSKGLGYKDHLRLLLFMNSLQDNAYRAMDMVQHNETRNGRRYLMASQIYAMEFRVTSTAEPIFTELPFVRKQLGLSPDYLLVHYFGEAY